MDFKKIVILLAILTIYINYENYFKEDTSRLYSQIESISIKVSQEENLSSSEKDFIKNNIDFKRLVFLSKEYSYSKAMGEIQNQITNSAKDICITKKIKWAQTASSTQWYEKLRMNISLECSPKNFQKFINTLRDKEKLYNIENFRVSKHRKKDILNISLQLVGYRVK